MPEVSGDNTAGFSAALSATSAAAASPAATPAPEAVTSEITPAAATAQPDAAIQPPESATTEAVEVQPQDGKPQGEPPKWRWQDILANARETAAKEAEARARQELEAQYSGLRDFAQLSPQERNGLLIMRAALAGHPQALAHVRSNQQAMQALQRMVAAEAAANETEPEPDLQTGDGMLVYSAPQLKKWQEWNGRRMRAELTKEIQPLQHVAQSMQAATETAEYTNTTQPVVDALKAQFPEFKEHGQAIWDVIRADPKLHEMALNRDTAAYAIRYAWGEVFRERVLPEKQRTSEATVLADIKRQAVASAANPGAATASSPKTFQPGTQGFQDALQHFSATGR